jgi:hypothetical protein
MKVDLTTVVASRPPGLALVVMLPVFEAVKADPESAKQPLPRLGSGVVYAFDLPVTFAAVKTWSLWAYLHCPVFHI